MKIAYVGAVNDCSGYAEAGRNNIAAILGAGIDVDVIPVSFEAFEKGNMGALGDMIAPHMKTNSDANVRIVHTVPLSYPQYIDPKAYNIGYTTWEADLIPPDWVEFVNRMDELWVPCKQNVSAFRNSGATLPIYVMPHTFDTKYASEAVENQDELPAVSQLGDSYVFYSIFQWLERKNPVGVLKAYLTEFKEDENVAMVIKTYMSNPNNISETSRLKQYIGDVKKLLRLESYPKLYLITYLLSRDQIELLHRRGDCYVHLARCEGFGQPITEAMLAKNPVIVCGYGGPEDYVQHKENGFLVDYQMTPVYGMPWHTYTAKMNWAEPDIMKTRQYMRYCFDNQQLSKQIGQKGHESIRDNNSWKAIGKLMANRLHEIEEKRLWEKK